MALIDVILRRRSVRSYLDRPVEKEKIRLCLEAARLAPSASNSQPWYFVVVDEPGLKNTLCDRAFGGLFASMRVPREAPVIVAVLARPQEARIRLGNLALGTDFNLIDLGIAGEHFALQAAELGLGTCWIGLFDERAVKKVLGIPGGYRVVNLFTLGYYDDAGDREHHRRPLAEIASFNGFGRTG